MEWGIEWIILVIVVCLIAILFVVKKGIDRRAILGGGGDEECAWCDDNEYGGGFDGGGPFRMSIRDPWYTQMLKGEKTVEARIDSPPFSNLKTGDPIIIVHSRPKGSTEQYTHGDYKYKTTVTKITKYDDLADLVKAVGVPALYPGKKTPIEAAAIFGEFATPEKLAGHGVLAIEVAKPPSGVRVPK